MPRRTSTSRPAARFLPPSRSTRSRAARSRPRVWRARRSGGASRVQRGPAPGGGVVPERPAADHRRPREPGFAPLSGFFEASDGWVRTHANYPHHRVRLLRALGLPDDATRDDAVAAIAERPAQELEDLVTADHGIAVRVRTLAEWMAAEQASAVARHPLLDVRRSTARRPVRLPVPGRPRVLDLTRVLAGPVATRALALARVRRAAGRQPAPARARGAAPRHRLREALDPGGPAGRARADPAPRAARPRRRRGDRVPARARWRPSGWTRKVLAEQHPHLVRASLSARGPRAGRGARAAASTASCRPPPGSP